MQTESHAAWPACGGHVLGAGAFCSPCLGQPGSLSCCWPGAHLAYAQDPSGNRSTVGTGIGCNTGLDFQLGQIAIFISNVRRQVTRAHLPLVFIVSIAAAAVLLLPAAWVTGGSYSPAKSVGPLSALVLVLPMVFAVKTGLDRSSALSIAFATYFVLIFAL